MQAEGTTPHGECKCGCGQVTPIVKHTVRARGYVKGQPADYLRGHRKRRFPVTPPVGDGFLHVWLRRTHMGYETPCWVWLLALNADGYGIDGQRSAHLTAYEREKGPVPKGLEIDHLCRVRHCVNVAHMEVVTHTENMQRSGATKLTWDQVREIRARWVTTASLAREFGVSPGTITRIVSGRSWKEPT